MTLEPLTIPSPPAASVLVWLVVGHENTVHGGNRSCDNGERVASVHSWHGRAPEVS